MKLEDIKQFLEFRQKFTKREWHEINEAVRLQENKRADQIVLDDSDIRKVMVTISQNNLLNLTAEERISIMEDIANDLGVWDKY
ncbi:hypothetical protein ACKRLN_01720 [Anaerococcus sp. DFU013_CI05]|uniref:hypothetical protein n=1 Tax=unclassified Anaerococcus TaxID=2614126 RepID=UPI0019327CAD|nr:hypothetical protein [Anaerococcus sp. mt242]MBM0046670.1 hypothetical protein [Anaerococcus sp. mt242]